MIEVNAAIVDGIKTVDIDNWLQVSDIAVSKAVIEVGCCAC